MFDAADIPSPWQVTGDALEFCNLAAELSMKNMTVQERAQFMKAKVAELESFFENGVWTEDFAGQPDPKRTLKGRFLLKWSKNPDGTPRAKARFVIQGFKDPDALAGSLETSSPTALRMSRIFLLVLTINGWFLFTADVSTAFLQGKPSDRQLWVALTTEACQILGYPADTKMKLLKSMYGLADAPRLWWREATDRLFACGFRAHPLDPCLFLSYAETKTGRTLD